MKPESREAQKTLLRNSHLVEETGSEPWFLITKYALLLLS